MKAKKILALLLSLIMVFSLCNVAMFAEGTAVAEVNGTQYGTLAEAIAAVPTDGTETTITMIADGSAADLVIAANQNIVLDLNGKTITANCAMGHNPFKVTAGTLTVRDTSETGTGKIYSSDTASALGAAIKAEQSGSLVFESGCVEAGLPISFSSTAASSLTITGGTFTRTKGGSTNSYVLHLMGAGTATITGGTFNAPSGNCIYTPGNGTPSRTGTLTISGGTFNATSNNAVVNTAAGTVIIEGGTFTNSSKASGMTAATSYATIKSIGSTLEITGGTFTNNNAEGYVLYQYNSSSGTKSASVSGGEFTGKVEVKGNKATQKAELSISGGTFSGTVNQGTNATLSISGGTYNADPSAYVAEGYEVIDNNDSTWTVVPSGVAQTGDADNKTNYDTVEEAIAAVDGSATAITITGATTLGDIALSSGDTITVENTSDPITGSEASAKEVTITKAGESATTAYVVSNGTSTGVVTSITKDETVVADNKTNVSDFIDVADILADAVANNATLDPGAITSMELSLSKTEETSSANAEVAAVLANGGAAFEVHPIAKITTQVGDAEPATTEYPITNEQLADNASFTFALNLGSAFANKTVVLTHFGTNGKEVLGVYTADANGDVTGIRLTSFSTVTAEETVAEVLNGTTHVAYYTTLAEAIAAAQNGDTVTLLTDVSVSATVEITKSITLDGDNHTLTTTYNRGIWIANSNVAVTIENMNIVSSNNAMERAIQVNTNCDNVTLNLNNITATATYYTVNVCANVDNLVLNIDNCDLTGWGAINLWGNNGTVNVSDSTLTGINDKPYNADGWNDFGVIILEGDTTGQTDEHSAAYDVTLTNCNINATSTTGNTQYVLLHNNPSANNELALDLCNITLGTNCEFYCDNAVESLTKIRNTFMSGTSDVPALPDDYMYTPIDDNYQLITQAVAQIGNTKYASLAEAIAAAKNGDTITIIADFAISPDKTNEADRIIVNKSVTIDFGEYTMYVPGVLGESNNWVGLYIQGTGVNVTLAGTTGGINCLDTESGESGAYSFYAKDGATVTVDGGNYHGGGTVAQVAAGEVIINDGYFSVTDYSEPYNGYRYVLNCVDNYYKNGTAKITVKGGTFKNFDPSNNLAEGANTNFVADGYEAVDNGDGTWTVQPAVTYVAQIGNTKYETLAEAIAAAQDDDTITLLTDVSVSEVVFISKSITLDGDNHTLTTTANRAIRVNQSNVNVTIENLEIVGGAKTERSVQVDSGMDGVTLNLNNITATATYYTVNVCGDVDNLVLKIDNCDLTGWGVINLWGNNGTVNVSKSTLTGINDKPYNADGWNDFGVIILEGDTTGQTDEHSAAYDVTLTNCNINATSTTGNTQYVLLHNNPSANNELALDLCNITLGTNCEFYCDNAVESLTKIRNTFMSGTSDVPALPDDYMYTPIDDNYQLITQAVAQIGNTKYASLAEAIAAAQDGDTITMLANSTSVDGYLINKTISIDTNGKTITVTAGANVNNRAFKINSGTLTVYGGGTIEAQGSGTTSSNGSGCYGAFRVEADGKLIANDITLENSRPWGLNVKVLGGEAELNNVTINSSYGGGIEVTEASLGDHSKAGTATLNNCTFNQENYFDHCSTAISVSGGSEVIVNGGTYTGENALYVFSSGGVITVNDGSFIGNRAAIIAAIDTNTYPEYTGGLQIQGGNYTGALNITSPAFMSITGGIFDNDPTAYVAEGYEAVALDGGNVGKWQVGKVKTTEIAPAEKAENYDATYTATKQVISTDGQEEVLDTGASVTVNVKVQTEGTVASNTALEKIKDSSLQNIIGEAVETANAADANADTIEVRISVFSDEGTKSTENNTITYEVHPVATAIVNDVEVGTIEISNDDLAADASFTITLPVPKKIATSGQRVKVSHISEDGENGTEIGTYLVENGTVTLIVTHFSKFELAPDDLETDATAKYFATLTLNDNIDVNFYVYNCNKTDALGKYTVEFTFGGETKSYSLTDGELAPGTTDVYGFVAASCRAEQMGDIINIVVKYDGKTIYSRDYSVKTYCENQIRNSTDQKLIDLCKSTLEYGEYAQRYFNYKTGDLVTENYSANKVRKGASPIDDTYNKAAVGGTNEVFSGASATLSLTSKTELNFYFKPADGFAANDYEFTVTKGGNEVTPEITELSGWIVVTVKGFAATELNDAVVVTGTNLTNKLSKSITYSPMSYAYRMQNKEITGTICQALYYYHLAAQAYFDAHKA